MTVDFTPHLTTLYPSTTYTTTPPFRQPRQLHRPRRPHFAPFNSYFTTNPYQPHPQARPLKAAGALTGANRARGTIFPGIWSPTHNRHPVTIPFSVESQL